MFGFFGRKKKKFLLVTCTIKVDTSPAIWQTSVRRVLNKSRGVSRFSIQESGAVEVVGTMDPEKLVRKLAKAGNQATFCGVYIPACSTGVCVYLDHDYSYGTGGHYTCGCGYEYRPCGGIFWPCYNGHYDWYPVNGYPASMPLTEY